MSEAPLTIEPRRVTEADIDVVHLDSYAVEEADVEVVADLDGLSGDNHCSCAASDDNPY